MAYTTINKSGDYFNTITYSGDGTSPKSITGFNFQPDLVWTKTRTYANNHTLFDNVRGAGSNKELSSNSSSSEGGVATGTYGYLSSFDTDGFTATSGSSGINYFNSSGDTYVNWGWLASNTTASNTDGSITSTVSANTSSGFSIVKYTGTGANATVGHGLGSAPKMILVKNLADAENWTVYHGANTSAPETDFLALNTTNATSDSNTVWNDTAPTSSVFSVGSSGKTNGSGDATIAYCFAEKTGFSKFGTYRGNVTTDNTFIYTGFAPAFWMMKNVDDPTNWMMFDSKRRAFNETQGYPINANESNAEDGGATGYNYDFLSNGIKIRGSNNNFSKDNDYIYMAFGEAPLVGTNNVPCTAR